MTKQTGSADPARGHVVLASARFVRAASLGLAARLLFADGDISAKLVGYGGWWLLALVTLVVAFAVGTSVLHWAHQRGDALTAANLATIATNAVPIGAGFVLFGESLPHGGEPCRRSRRSPAWWRAQSRSGTSRRRRPKSGTAR